MSNHSLCYLVAALLVVGVVISPAQTHVSKTHSLNINFQRNAEHCADMKVESDGATAMVNETFSLQKSEAPMLEMSMLEHSVFQVRGWDRPDSWPDGRRKGILSSGRTSQELQK